MAEAERNFQLQEFNKQLDEFKPEQSLKAERVCTRFGTGT